MRRSTFDDGFVEDSEGEGDMMAGPPITRSAVSELPPPPRLPPPIRTMDTTVSSIQSPNFTSLAPELYRPQPPTSLNPHNETVSTIQTANFTTDHVSEFVSSFPPVGLPYSTIQAAQIESISAGGSVSTSVSARAPVASRGKPRPRPIFKKKDPTAAASAADTSISSGAPSSIPPSSVNVSFLSLHAMLPPLPPMQVSSTPSHTATTVLVTQRVSDSGVEIPNMEMMDIAERAKLRSRGRSQAKGKQPIIYDSVIELSSSDDELSSLPRSKSKPKPKPKPKAKKPIVSKEPSSDKGKSRDPSKPSPSKRPKTTHNPDDFGSDVDTIPMATSDFPIPAQPVPLLLPPHMRHLSSQLPPSDPPAPPSTSGSSAPRSPQDMHLNVEADRFRDDSPLSSPPPPMPRKRKRPPPPPSRIPSLDDEDDSYMGVVEDSILPGPGPGGMVPVVEITKIPKKSRSKGSDPPLPSSSPGIVPETQIADPPAKDMPAVQKKRKSAAEDAEEWDAGLDEELLAQAEKSKSKKRSRVVEEDEEEYGASSKPKTKAKKDRKTSAKEKGKEKAPPKEKAAKGKASVKGNTLSSASKGIVEGSEAGLSIMGKDQDAMPPPAMPEPASKRKEKDRLSLSKGASDDPEAPVEASAPKRGKGKQRALILSDDEDDGAQAADISTNAVDASLDIDPPPLVSSKKGGRKSSGEQGSKENEAPTPAPPRPASTSNSTSLHPSPPSISTLARPATATPQPARTSFAHVNRAYTISSKKTKSTPMSELIRRVSSLPGSPFPVSSRSTYSPLAKASKSTLRRIAPLHPNRRTPPPPPPRPPPPKKSKKMLEMEERWEMELEDSVEGWYAMPEEERAALRRAKRDHEFGFED